ncbi:MAG: hypothetical protein ACO4AU_05815 [bacterium]|jgi:hypothetical protein
MRRAPQRPEISLFPFLSVLLSTMGVLAFLSISFVISPMEDQRLEMERQVEFQWVGAPGYVNPVYIRCREDRIEYFDLFLNQERQLVLDEVVFEFAGSKLELLDYLIRLEAENQRIRREFGTTEHYPLLLVYPDGVLSAEFVMTLVEQVEGLNVGLEPMLPHWEVPYRTR